MGHSTINTYQLKREILGISKRLSKDTHKDQQKFTRAMLYGVLASGSCVLSRMADYLQEGIRKKDTVERLSSKLTENILEEINEHYLTIMQGISAKDPPIFLDDSDVEKPYGKAFEALGLAKEKGGQASSAITKKRIKCPEPFPDVTDWLGETRRNKLPPVPPSGQKRA